MPHIRRISLAVAAAAVLALPASATADPCIPVDQLPSLPVQNLPGTCPSSAQQQQQQQQAPATSPQAKRTRHRPHRRPAHRSTSHGPTTRRSTSHRSTTRRRPTGRRAPRSTTTRRRSPNAAAPSRPAPVPQAAPSVPSNWPGRPFSPSSFWNMPLSVNAPLDPRSPTLVAELLRQVLAAGTWINTTTYSVPVYVVDQSTPTVYVQLDTPNSMYTNATDAAQLQHDLRWVPIPAGAVPSNGTDKHMVIWRPSTDTMWDLWRVENYGTPAIPNWHAYWGAKLTSVSASDGIDPRPFGATASGLPAIGGLIQASELASGRIDHAIAIAIPDAARWRYVWPANRTDGLDTGPNAIPEGARFRLDPKLDVASLHLSPTATAIALAAQRYGLVVRDRAGAVAFFAQDPRPLGIPDPYPRLFGGYPSAALSGFPWGRLRALPER